MSTLKHKGYSAISTPFASATINSGSIGTSSEIDNSSNLDLFDDLEITVTSASGPALNAPIDFHIMTALDDSSYPTLTTLTVSSRAATLNLINNTSANVYVLHNIPIPPQKYKYCIANNSGQNATVVVRRRPHSLQVT